MNVAAKSVWSYETYAPVWDRKISKFSRNIREEKIANQINSMLEKTKTLKHDLGKGH